ncbi:MAG: ribosomal-processing cysteine protease Prp [Firmicutes bacterium]|nr:ribosomal-processing cysteine protease Prp [Bacillota bacterium]
MINVVKNKNIIEITGHANFDDYGKDIVCASVSSIVITTVNGILEINRDSLKYEQKKINLQ